MCKKSRLTDFSRQWQLIEISTDVISCRVIWRNGKLRILQVRLCKVRTDVCRREVRPFKLNNELYAVQTATTKSEMIIKLHS